MKHENAMQISGILTLLRICTVLLAAVSFWSTAQGMLEYTFPVGWQAYAASLGVQGLLLGLNFALPSFLRRCETDGQRISLLALTAVVLFCSSWFSYLYIAGQAYGGSWDTERRLLSQSVYREELFKADDYIERYQDSIEQSLTDQVLALYDQAASVDANKLDVNEHLDWNLERVQYADGSAASDLMNQAIDAMENATVENASQSVREQAISILTAAQTELQSRLATLEIQITTANNNVSTAATALQSSQTRLQNAAADVDTTPLIAAVNSAAQNYNRSVSRLSTLEQQRDDYQDASSRIGYYSTTLGMAQEGVSIYYIGANLREIQSELFKSEPDSARMLELAADIFDRLQDAVDLASDGGAEYQGLIAQTNRFVQNLTRYGSVKVASSELRRRVESLAAGDVLSIDENVQSEGWQERWVETFNDLKSLISGLPVYTATTGADEGLFAYDRTASSQHLDDAIRRYLTRHNAAQQGIIYLESPYRGVAVFSVFVAFLLDIAAFVTGVIIDRVSMTTEMKRTTRQVSAVYTGDTQDNEDNGYMAQNIPAWAITRGLNRYVFLTGDYTYQNETTIYHAIENGTEASIELSDRNKVPGFYRWQNGNVAPVMGAELQFKGTGDAPQDGVYRDCILNCEDELLTVGKEGERRFLGNVAPNTPVYLLTNNQYEVIPAKDLLEIKAETAVVALNADGTRIAAIYIIQ